MNRGIQFNMKSYSSLCLSIYATYHMHMANANHVSIELRNGFFVLSAVEIA